MCFAAKCGAPVLHWLNRETNTMLDFEHLRDFIQAIRFKHILPGDKGLLLSTPQITGIDFDVRNTILPQRAEETEILIRPLCSDILRMSTFAIGAIVNLTVSHMLPNESYVNVGVWNGFTLFSGMVGNTNKRCIGIDNFSGFGGPKEQFLANFNRLKSENHDFFELDYKVYFKEMHRGNIGVYYYDGDHSEEHQCEGLRIAEPYLSRDAVIIIDDVNRPGVILGTNKYIRETRLKFRLVGDLRTANDGHPTFWNGLIVMQRTA